MLPRLSDLTGSPAARILSQLRSVCSEATLCRTLRDCLKILDKAFDILWSVLLEPVQIVVKTLSVLFGFLLTEFLRKGFNNLID